VLASGRAPRHMRDVHDELGLTTPVIGHNGALVTDLATNTVIHQEPIQLATARRVMDIIQQYQPDVNLHLETHHGEGDSWHVDRLDERVDMFVKKYRVLPPNSVGAIQALLRDESALVSKLWFAAPKETMSAVKEHLLRELEHDIDTLGFDDVSLTILATGVSKAAAMAWVAAHYDVTAAEVMAIGDEINDIPLIGWAGLGIAMGNATPEVKAVAKELTASNAEHGVARAIQRHLLPPSPASGYSSSKT